MYYSILFGGEASIKFENAETFKTMVAASSGIQALQRSTEPETTTYRLGDKSLPEDVRNDWSKIAEHLVNLPEPEES